MADRKQYLSRPTENGQILISEDVIATIAYHALTDIEGYVGLTAKTNAEFPVALNHKNWSKGIRITVTDKGNLIVELNILVLYGFEVMNIAAAIQNAVSTAVSSVTGITPRRVHVNICGVIRK